ncbi:alpha/beta hydrolase [Massilia sp. Dwa41.01b]|uniref:dienelactone hydrolase family protein n=1 Tax=unclassified Massilia TaxID=2609279 RepID=UPI0016028862|nr:MULTISPECIES: dienelactone hydrolase family protein [unclassified Massilia]QNA87929.1 alpha/beta hydrolase [Massilia sp. Dwa41.01b]QNA98832.1 alpha/beta hydrolase [Massilia sp. Se16.2.3]
MQRLNKTRSCCAALLLACAGLAVSNQVLAVENGPAPSLASIQADGPYAVSTQTVSGSGFGGGTVYSPNTAGKYAVVAVCPGFTATQSSIAAISRRLATHGFVVVTINTTSVYDFPSSRANQLLAALRTVTALATGPVAGKMDTTRQGVAGWSMGGGGAMLAAGMTPGLKGGVAFAPWSQSNNVSRSAVPMAYLAGTADTVAPAGSHASVFYNATPATTKKLLGVITGADHNFPKTASQPASYTQVAWMKRFLDGDTRYAQFLKGDTRFTTFRSTGPF